MKTAYQRHTEAWVREVVIGLNLCPFAAEPAANGRIRFVVEETTQPAGLMRTLLSEIQLLSDQPPEVVETTLIIHPQILLDFEDYLDFAAEAVTLLMETDLYLFFQIATFHPDYQFAGTGPDDVENFTNRSPYPMLHLLREASIDRAVASYPKETKTIFENNKETMRRLGADGIRKLWASIRES